MENKPAIFYFFQVCLAKVFLKNLIAEAIFLLMSEAVYPNSVEFFNNKSADKLCMYTAATIASSEFFFCAINEAITPVRTSPVPNLAIPGLPVVLISASPSGVKIIVGAPLSTEICPGRFSKTVPVFQ